ncbi:19724_t:CDS:1, partial [Racocetra persica]
ENKAIDFFKQAAFNDEEAIDFCEKKNIEYPISKNNYLRTFKTS